MMQVVKGVVFILVVFSQGFLCLGAREETDYQQTFEKAKKMYAADRYDSTVAIIREYLKKHGREAQTEFVVPLLMEALIRQNDITYFKKLLNIYLRKFPKSAFLPRIHYLNGIVEAREKNYREAIESFSAALDGGVTRELDSMVIFNVNELGQSHIPLQEFSRILNNEDLNTRIKEILWYSEIVALFQSGQMARTNNRSEEFRQEYPRSSYVSKVKKMMSRSKSIQKKNIQVGVLAPLTGDNADVGKYVVQGIQLAVDSYNKNNTPPIELIILDTRGNLVETAKKVRELTDVHKVSIIIGPMLSDNATVAAAMLMDNPDVVMITPTATDDGIAQLGKNVFQMNVTLGILGKRIARYAVENLNIKEFAIIAPLTEYGSIMSENFKSEVVRCGGVVLNEESFEEGTNDFRAQFESLRSKLAERKWEQKAFEGQREYGKEGRDRKALEMYLSDSTIEVGGLFLPVESEDAIKISSQVYFHRIRTQVLGSNGWHNNAVILGGKKYVENVLFSSNFESDMNNEKWISFAKSFKDRYKDVPDRVAAPLGYDAASLIISSIRDGDDDAEIVAENLRTVKNYQGVSGTISFDNEDGVNSEAAILKISNKKFIRVQ